MMNLFYLLAFYVSTLIVAFFMFKIQKRCSFFEDRIYLHQFSPLIVFFLFVISGISSINIVNVNINAPVIKNSLTGSSLVLLTFAISFLFIKLFHKHKDNIDIKGSGVICTGMLIGAFTEETGWRVYLPFLLKDIIHWELAYLLIGLLIGLWHYWHFKYGIVFMIFFVLLNMAFSYIAGSLTIATGNNLIIPSLMHFVLGMCFFVFFRYTWSKISVIGTLSFILALVAIFLKFAIVN